MAWEERQYYLIDEGVAPSVKEFLDAAYTLLNLFTTTIETFHTWGDHGDEESRSYIRHITGHSKVKVKITDLPSGTLARVWVTGREGTGNGTILLNISWFDCLRRIYVGSSNSSSGWRGVDVSNPMAALIDLAATGVADETAHVVWRDEHFAGCLEGWLRFVIQSNLGYFLPDGTSVNPRACQTSWPCSACDWFDVEYRGCDADRVEALQAPIPHRRSCSGECFPT